MKRGLMVVLMMVLMLSACGQASGMAEDQQLPTAEELGLPETMDLEFVAGEQVQATPATLYIGKGYSIYVPDTGWKLEQDREDGVPEDTWESTQDEDVEFAVSHYGTVSAEEAVAAFLEEHGDYVFQDLLLDSGEAKEPLEGVNEDGDVLKFLMRAGKEGIYIVSWKYRDAFGSAASQAEQIVRTFVLV